MSYYNESETKRRIENIRKILIKNNLDAALIYYDELNIANGWYLTGWCPQFEKGAVLLPINGEPLLLGGPESEPFAKMNSAIKATRNFPVFMVPDEEYPNAEIISFQMLNEELLRGGTTLKRVGVIGTNTLPHAVFTQFESGFKGVELVDITDEYELLRSFKSAWEIENVRNAFGLTYEAYLAMKSKVAPGSYEYEIAAEGEYICRKAGANSFAYGTIVGSGKRTNAVVPTAINKQLDAGEWVMLGIAPRINGYAGCFGETIPVSGEYTKEQKDSLNILREAVRLTKEMLRPGKCGIEIDKPARELFTRHGLIDYLVCPFAHTIGLMEAESPFYGPNGTNELVPGMTICVDVSFFGHPTLYGARVESGYVITQNGCEPLSPEMDKIITTDIE
ncbi:Xaa-Pro peptidase family protein [Faecalicatena sp. AGMB00832]|uniref:Xaa-Pro peptidase family protein n=1 Tax=Faecalicatena faecalis TaxID=2726362 RepID=A0ABS6D509_9FIRM|nr:Xaa-Pro peptidase family protein [Faecalicatena faecalis]MBU3876266.1 Xaa-Pro peptidase family protein [Faecalicatena faecalis]